jgi:hypothetical protein
MMIILVIVKRVMIMAMIIFKMIKAIIIIATENVIIKTETIK